MATVRIENIVFITGSDYEELCLELDPDYDPEGCVAAWIEEDALLNYLLQWWYPGEHGVNEYKEEQVTESFLGHRVEHQGETFLLSHNSSHGYAGLGRIIK